MSGCCTGPLGEGRGFDPLCSDFETLTAGLALSVDNTLVLKPFEILEAAMCAVRSNCWQLTNSLSL
jgi:hypothetical protein